jgi:hypothetical protein
MAGTYRVTIDIPRIQANVFEMEGGRLTELAVRNWLHSVGFSPESNGRTWLVAEESLGRLDRSEILRVDRVHEVVAAAPAAARG